MTALRSAECEGCPLSQGNAPGAPPRCAAVALGIGVSHRVNVRPMDPLYRTGDPLGVLYVVRSGLLKTSILGEGGIPVIVDYHLPGDLIGAERLLQIQKSSTTTALMTSDVCAFHPFHPGTGPSSS